MLLRPTWMTITYTCVGQLDLFRDESIEYVVCLVKASVDVGFHLYMVCFHAFESCMSRSRGRRLNYDG